MICSCFNESKCSTDFVSIYGKQYEPAHEIVVLIAYATSEGSGEPEPSLFAYMNYGSGQRVRPKFRHLHVAPLDDCACVFEEWIYGGQKVQKSHELTHNNLRTDRKQFYHAILSFYRICTDRQKITMNLMILYFIRYALITIRCNGILVHVTFTFYAKACKLLLANMQTPNCHRLFLFYLWKLFMFLSCAG